MRLPPANKAAHRLTVALVLGFVSTAAVAGTGISAPSDAEPLGEPGCRESERWPVKVLADPAALKVRFRAAPTTVEALLRLPRPRRVTNLTPRIAPHEFKTFRVHAQLVAARRNSGTDDIEVVIRGTRPRDTLVAVFPDERCPTFATSAKAEEMHTAEHQFTVPCGTTLKANSWTQVRARATVTGVGFFAIRRSSAFSAPNGFELHPVLEFRTSQCTRP